MLKLVIIFISLFIFNYSQEIKDCYQHEKCVKIKDCPPLVAALQTGITEENREKLNKLCGFSGNTPNVCCDERDIVPTTLPITQTKFTDDCFTPNSKKGQCISIYSCDPIIRLIKQRPLTENNKNFIKNSQCGYERGKPKVCCEKVTIQSNQTPIQTPNQTPNQQENEIDTGIDLVPNSRFLPTIDTCGTQVLNDKVIGGEKTSLEEFPWLALVGYENDPNDFGCGGTLISARYVLSAAHCVKGEAVKVLGKPNKIRLGEYDTKNQTDCTYRLNSKNCAPPIQDIPIETAIAHPGWVESDKNQYNDISLIRLQREAEIGDYVYPICLPNKNFEDLSSGEKLFVAGWGQTELDFSSNIKLKLIVPVVTNQKCSEPYNSKFRQKITLIDKQMCAGGEKGKDSCKGDSGGPLMYQNINVPDGNPKWFLIGVVSFGPYPCAQDGVPGVYTNVKKYINWIISNMK